MALLEGSRPARIIGWDTSSRTGYLFAGEVSWNADGRGLRLVQSRSLDVDQRQHSEGLLFGIADTLEAIGWTIADIDAIGIGVGPGSFTGVRVGLTTARTLGQVQGIPLLPVSSLELQEVALRRSSGTWDDPMLICADACMGEVYCRMSPGSGLSAMEVVTKISLLGERLQEWGALWAKASATVARRVILPGAWDSHPALVEWFSGSSWAITPASALDSLAEALSELVAREWNLGKARAALEVHPVYLRVSDAELHLRARENALREGRGGG